MRKNNSFFCTGDVVLEMQCSITLEEAYLGDPIREKGMYLCLNHRGLWKVLRRYRLDTNARGNFEQNVQKLFFRCRVSRDARIPSAMFLEACRWVEHVYDRSGFFDCNRYSIS